MEQPLVINLQVLIRSLIIVIFTVVLTQIVQRIRKFLHANLLKREMDPSRKNRIATSISVIVTTLNGVFIIGGLISVLTTLGIDMTPILASLGIVGLAFSLGAQALIKDFLAGLAILTENQFAVGDDIKVGTVSGTVEEISMRATRVREFSGLLTVLPNSEVRVAANASREWMRAIVDLNLPYSADLHLAHKALVGAAAQCAADETVKDLLLDPPVVTGWNGLSDWAVQIRLAARTLPGKQYAVQVALRKYAIDALNQTGIPIATSNPQIRE